MRQTFIYIQNELLDLYDASEARDIAFLLIEKLTGMSRSDVLVNKDTVFSVEQRKQIATFVEKLKKAVPVQYVLGEADFYGLRFAVNGSVLIPRPETEELVEWVECECRSRTDIRLLDIGTGSGCIPVALKKRLPGLQADAFDVSSEALQVASYNARLHGVQVRFRQCDILQNPVMDEKWDIIVSNPPYIPEHEKARMARQVLDYEPPLALFVPDSRPLLFYERIAAFARQHLRVGGRIYFEIHYDAGRAVVELLRNLRFCDVELRRDLAGNDRMVRAVQCVGSEK